MTENNVLFLFASLNDVVFYMEFTLKGKNLLLEEQILSFKIWSYLKGRQTY